MDERPVLDEALAASTKGLSLNPSSLDLHNFAGAGVPGKGPRGLAERGEDPLPFLELAQQAFERVRNTAPRRPIAYENLSYLHTVRAQYLRARGRDPRPSLRAALQAAQEAQQLAPTFQLAWINHAHASQLLAAFALEAQGGSTPSAEPGPGNPPESAPALPHRHGGLAVHGAGPGDTGPLARPARPWVGRGVPGSGRGLSQSALRSAEPLGVPRRLRPLLPCVGAWRQQAGLIRACLGRRAGQADTVSPHAPRGLRRERCARASGSVRSSLARMLTQRPGSRRPGGSARVLEAYPHLKQNLGRSLPTHRGSAACMSTSDLARLGSSVSVRAPLPCCRHRREWATCHRRCARGLRWSWVAVSCCAVGRLVRCGLARGLFVLVDASACEGGSEGPTASRRPCPVDEQPSCHPPSQVGPRHRPPKSRIDASAARACASTDVSLRQSVTSPAPAPAAGALSRRPRAAAT